MLVALSPRHSITISGVRIVNNEAFPVRLVVLQELPRIKIDNRPFPRCATELKPLVQPPDNPSQ